MARTNIDKAVEATEYLPKLRAQRDRWCWQAWAEDGMSHGAIAAALGVTRQAAQQACARGATREVAPSPPPVASTRQERGAEVAPRFRS